MNPIVHFAIYHDLDRLTTVCANRIYRNSEWLFSQAPLHEGRGNGIDRSGGVYVFAAAKRQLMRRLVSGNRVGPQDLTFVISNQEKKVFL